MFFYGNLCKIFRINLHEYARVSLYLRDNNVCSLWKIKNLTKGTFEAIHIVQKLTTELPNNRSSLISLTKHKYQTSPKRKFLQELFFRYSKPNIFRPRNKAKTSTEPFEKFFVLTPDIQ